MTDNQMPLMNGLDLSKYLENKRNKGEIDYYLSMVSADDNEIEDLQHEGINLFVQKPLTYSKFNNIVKKH